MTASTHDLAAAASVGATPAPVTYAAPAGIAVIGRNEGARLRLCLESVLRSGAPVVYADSGSTDGSVEVARSLGVAVVQLDPERPFSAARGRNEAFERLTEMGGAEFVQFVDGDCELDAAWMQTAIERLRARPTTALVCGRLREKHRERSVYGRLCDMEWQGPTGPIESCGGIFLVRAVAFRGVGGFIAGHVAGEEPDLCARLRRAGWNLERMAAEMGTHDACMTRFGQWWKRSVRAGWAYAKAASPGNAERSSSSVKRVVMTLGWAAGLPLAALAITVVQPWPAGALAWAGTLLAYAALFWRVRGHRLRAGNSPADASLYGAFCLLGKWAETIGLVRYWLGAL